MRHQLYLAPLQSFTDFHFRNAFQQVFGDVDRFYAPYLKMTNEGQIKEGPKKDVLPIHNPFEAVVPQVLVCGSHDFLIMAEYLQSLGYDEVNWNMGCPYPMVAKRDLGSGILNQPDRIVSILEEVMAKTPLKIGLKMRMGYEDTSDILRLLPLLNKFDFTEIIVHARYGKQLYQGGCDHDRFTECIPLTKHQLVYNGDINTVDDFREVSKKFSSIQHWMIGRGAIANPFLFEMIQEDSDEFPEDWEPVFYEFLQLLLASHLKESSNEGNILLKTKHFWEYFESGIPMLSPIYRKVKKLKSLDDYHHLISI